MDISDHPFLPNALWAILGLLVSACLTLMSVRLLMFSQVTLAFRSTELIEYLLFALYGANWLLARKYSLIFKPESFFLLNALVSLVWWLSIAAYLPLSVSSLEGNLPIARLVDEIMVAGWFLMALGIPVGASLAVRFPAQRRSILLRLLYLTGTVFLLPTFALW